MKEDDNDILDFIFSSFKDTPSDNKETYDFFVKIKENCPQTIFHGTDVGHQGDTIGARYLRFLLENGNYPSEEHEKTNRIIQQGYKYYGESGKSNYKYREKRWKKTLLKSMKKLKVKTSWAITEELM